MLKSCTSFTGHSTGSDGWESSESGVSENKKRRLRFIVSHISKSRCGAPGFIGQMWAAGRFSPVADTADTAAEVDTEAAAATQAAAPVLPSTPKKRARNTAPDCQTG